MANIYDDGSGKCDGVSFAKRPGGVNNTAIVFGVPVRFGTKCAGRAKNYSTNFRILVRRGRICGIAKRMYRCYSKIFTATMRYGNRRIASLRRSGSNCDVGTNSSDRNICDVMSKKNENNLRQC